MERFPKIAIIWGFPLWSPIWPIIWTRVVFWAIGPKNQKYWTIRILAPSLARPGPPGPPWPAPGRPAPSARQARRSPTRRTRASNLASPDLPEKRSWAIILKLDLWPSSILNEKTLDLPFWSWACGPASFLITNHYISGLRWWSIGHVVFESLDNQGNSLATALFQRLAHPDPLGLPWPNRHVSTHPCPTRPALQKDKSNAPTSESRNNDNFLLRVKLGQRPSIKRTSPMLRHPGPETIIIISH